MTYAEQTKTKPYDENRHTGVLRHLTGRYIDGQLLVTVVVNGDRLPSWRVLAEELKKRFDDFGLFVNFNTAKTNVILGKRTEWLFGRKAIESSIDGIKFFVRPDSFFQVNFDVMRLIYDRVKQAIREHEVEVLPCARRAFLGTKYVAYGFVEVGLINGAGYFAFNLGQRRHVLFGLKDFDEKL